jgi:hypothetical protein
MDAYAKLLEGLMKGTCRVEEEAASARLERMIPKRP